MDLVRRDEFDAVREMAVKAREENETLLARVAVLEAMNAPASEATQAAQYGRVERQNALSEAPRG